MIPDFICINNLSWIISNCNKKKYATRFFGEMRIKIYMINDYSQMSSIYFAPDFYIEVQTNIG